MQICSGWFINIRNFTRFYPLNIHAIKQMGLPTSII